MRTDIEEKKSEILGMIDNNESKAKICKHLKCKPITLDNFLKKWNITYSGNKGLKGIKTSPYRKSAEDYSKNETLKVPKLRQKLIEDGIKVEECEICHLNEWFGKKLTLELHHIDGNRFNNDFDNLQLLCPNCHSITPNHSKKKKMLL